ncbi:hypothetical protein DFJ73DRAFT_248279 [Zopfochytrium polystomum]|nr:hypothetical protein DFJ73DRAFT_248279 [Zopfochytrium polystomum]
MTDSSSSDAKKRKIDNNVVDLTELTEEDMDIVDSPAPVRTASIIKTAMSKPVFNVRGTHLDKLVGTVPVSSTAEQIEPTTSKVKSTTFDDDVVPSTQPAPRAEIFAPPSLESSTLANSRAAHPAAPSKDGTLLKRVQMQETLEKLKKIRKVMEGREDETTSKPLPFSHATKPSETNPAHAVGDGTSTDYLKGRMNDLTKKLATRISVDVSRPSVVDNLNLISRDSGISAVNSVRPHDKILPVTEEEEDNAQTIVDGGLTLKTKSISKDLSRDSGFSSLNAARPFDKVRPPTLENRLLPAGA